MADMMTKDDYLNSRDQNLSKKEIAEKFGMAVPTLYNYLKRFDIETAEDEIEALRDFRERAKADQLELSHNPPAAEGIEWFDVATVSYSVPVLRVNGTGMSVSDSVTKGKKYVRIGYHAPTNRVLLEFNDSSGMALRRKTRDSASQSVTNTKLKLWFMQKGIERRAYEVVKDPSRENLYAAQVITKKVKS